LRAPR